MRAAALQASVPGAMTASVRTDGVPRKANGALSSWRDGPTKRAILDFVAAASGEDGSEPVAPEERVAVFDNDGTLWCEKPVPIQMDFILRRFVEMARADPSLCERQPWKAASEKDHAWFATVMAEHYAGDDHNVKTLAGGVLAAYAGVSVEDFETRADTFLRGAQHPTLGRGYAGARLPRRRAREADSHVEPHRAPAAARRRQLERRHPDARLHAPPGQAVPAPARAPR
jgi:hypothetical protein